MSQYILNGARMERNLLRISKVLDRTGLSRSVLYSKVAAGTFPPPVKISDRAIAWPSDQVTSWIEQTIRGGSQR